MPASFKELFHACERATDLLGRLADPGPPRCDEAELIPLLADLGDLAVDHGVDDESLCNLRMALVHPCQRPVDPRAMATAARLARQQVRRLRTAIHVEGQRRLRAALIGN